MSGTGTYKNRKRRYRSKKLKMPANWLDCPPIADTTIAETFVVFKTPLDYNFEAHVPSEKKFNVCSMLTILKQREVKLGLWIDLTNTNKYYDKIEIRFVNYPYVKFFCQGKKSPTRDQTRSFINICSSFVENNPLLKIAIHCTHGFNRSGFMIVAYLIEKLNYSVRDAIALFAAVRPPGIYRQYLINDLYYRYSNEKPTLAPEIPSWVIDYD